MFLEISQNSQLQASACNFIKKETLAQVLSCEFCKISSNTFFTELVRATASAHTPFEESNSKYYKTKLSLFYRE